LVDEPRYKTPAYVVELADELINDMTRSDNNCGEIHKLRIKNKDVLKIGKVIVMINIKLYKRYIDNTCPLWGTGGNANNQSPLLCFEFCAHM